jgi:hypothetical protein
MEAEQNSRDPLQVSWITAMRFSIPPFASRKIQHQAKPKSIFGTTIKKINTDTDLCMYMCHHGNQNPRDYAASFRMPNSSSSCCCAQVVEVY